MTLMDLELLPPILPEGQYLYDSLNWKPNSFKLLFVVVIGNGSTSWPKFTLL